MLARIINHGKTRALPTCIGNVRIIGRQSVDLRNAKAIDEISKYQFIEVQILEQDKAVKVQERQTAPKIDYSKYPINELRSIAASMKIAGFFTMKKIDLVKTLEEKQNE